jgi:hypothetical protein
MVAGEGIQPRAESRQVLNGLNVQSNEKLFGLALPLKTVPQRVYAKREED